jgi:hypothetical protein
MNQSNVGAGRSVLFISARFLSTGSFPVGIALCGPGKNTDDVPGPPPLGGPYSQKTDNTEAPGNPASKI